MNYKIIVTERAENHLLNAVEWYEEQEKGRGQLFVVSFKDCLKLLIRNPFAFAVIYKKIRKANTKKYPYSLYYWINESQHQVIVFAVLHSSRNPETWQQIADEQNTE